MGAGGAGGRWSPWWWLVGKRRGSGGEFVVTYVVLGWRAGGSGAGVGCAGLWAWPVAAGVRCTRDIGMYL